ncbi:MAG: MFS transporter [Anaerolineae bacterium]|nr:MFS transporter [Anaerolineae bacterium]
MSARGWKLRFSTIWTGQAFSLLGSALVRFALIWWLTEQTGSAAVLATASLMASLPPILLGPVVGTLVDRWPRRWIMVVADGAIALLTAVLSYLYWRGVVETWHIYAILFARAIGTAFHDPAMTASTSLMVPRKHLARVAGIDQTRQAVTEMGGPVLGALLVALFPIQGVLAIDIVTAVLAIVPLLVTDIPQPVRVDGHDATRSGGWQAVLRETGDGFGYLWNWRGLFIMLVTIALVPFVNSPAWALIPLLVRDYFGGGPAEWSWFSVARQAGILVGGVLMTTWGGFRRKMVTMVGGLAILGVVNLVRGVVPANAYWLFLVAAFVSGTPAAMFFATLKALLQSTVPPEMQGRVFATQNSLFWAMRPLGMAILGPLADVIGIRTLFFLSGIVFLLVALTWSLTPSVRNIERLPPGGGVPVAGEGV